MKPSHNCLFVPGAFWVDFFFLRKWSCHVNKDSFLSFFQICIPFISFPCLIALARIPNMTLKSRDERKHPCLVPTCVGKLEFLTIKYDMSYTLFYRYSSSSWESSPLFQVYREFLSWMGAGVYQIVFLHLWIWSCGFSSLTCWCDKIT